MKTKTEILNDVVALVKRQGGRAINKEGLCSYLTEDGKICGHSMACKPEMRKVLYGIATDKIENFGDGLHLPEYQGHEPDFWKNVQSLHDIHYNWTKDNELSEEGQRYINEIIQHHEK